MTKLKSHQLINQDSGDVEYYTPIEIVDAARRVMSGIDLDPFSSAIANERVKANRYFTKEMDALKQSWLCQSFWMNHPYSREMNKICIERAESEYTSGRVVQGCCITFAATSEKWFQPLMLRPQCYLSPRTNYYLPDGTKKKGVTKGSVITYFGTDVEAFAREFANFGTIKVAFRV